MGRLAAIVVALVGCQQPLFGPPTESVCPPASTLTYASFAEPFMTRYCTRCHDSSLPPGQRMGAPTFHDFDTRTGILVVADHVDQTSAASATVVNTSMPPSGPYPTTAERELLGEWLACGLP